MSLSTIHLPSQELTKVLVMLSNSDHTWNYSKHMGKGTSMRVRVMAKSEGANEESANQHALAR